MPANNKGSNNRNNNRNSGGGGFIDKIFGFIFLIALLAGGGFFIISNNITSVDDLMEYVRDKSDKLSECTSPEDSDSVDCLKTTFFPDVELPNGDNNPSESVDANGLLQTLETIPLAEPQDVEYDRSEYKHWTTFEGSCNTREFILKEQGVGVNIDEDCAPTSGEWIDPYSGETITDSSKSDIDHVIPLGYANAHGGADWDSATKEAFANDITQLLAVTASENRSKSDSGPSDYMPSNKGFNCEYSSIWINTASKYNLTITVADRDVLQEALQECA